MGLLQRWLVFFYKKKDWVIFEFTGIVFFEEIPLWVKTFTNFMFGITAKSLDDPKTKACSTKLKLEKVLFDTDFLYFKEPPHPHKYIPLSVLVGVCNNNAIKLYGLTN